MKKHNWGGNQENADGDIVVFCLNPGCRYYANGFFMLKNVKGQEDKPLTWPSPDGCTGN